MNLAQINYFLALCEVGTFTGAAAVCGISQQSLSAAIRRLEHELEGPLFDRGPPLRLSPLGEAVKPHFEAILREIDKIHQLSSEGLTHSGNDQGREVIDPSDAFTCARRRVMTV
jgi:LysR family transcriptional regulator, hydrogen peroxide-inducible genes activator